VSIGVMVAAVLMATMNVDPGANREEGASQAACQWRLLAAADIVISGRLVIPKAALDASLRAGGWEVVPISIEDPIFLKGDSALPLRLEYIPHASPFRVRREALLLLDGRAVLAFIVQGSDSVSKRLYFVPSQCGGACQAVMQSDPASIAVAAKEIARQATVIASPDVSVVGDEKRVATVATLADMLTRVETQREGTRRLFSLGPEFVPELVGKLSDMRPLGEGHMEVPNREGDEFGFEAVSLYAPEVVADVVTTALNYITGENFGTLANGGTAGRRARIVGAWHLYLQSPKRGCSQPE
jgi:hypothetical protein